MSGIISRHILSIQIKPWRGRDEFLPQVIAFKEGEEHHLAGIEQVTKELKELLPEIEENYYRSLSFALEIRKGDEIEAGIVRDFFANIETAGE